MPGADRVRVTASAEGAFVRHFGNGLVVVNPGDAALAYTLPASMRLVTPVGGGTVPDDGQLPPPGRCRLGRWRA